MMNVFEYVEIDDSWLANNITKKAIRQKFLNTETEGSVELEIGKTIALCEECQAEESHIVLWREKGQEEWKLVHTGLNQCNSCIRKEREKEAQELIQQQANSHSREINRRLVKDYWIVPKNLEEAGFKTYKEINSVTAAAKKETIRYIRDFKSVSAAERTNLLLMGSPGTGKSHLCVSIGRTLLNEGYAVGFLTTGALLTKIKSTYQKGSSRSEEGIMADIEQLDLLILDDVGSESGSKSEFDWSKKTLFEIINRRIGRPTIYTSNFNDNELGEAIGTRTASRLHANTKFINLFTDDYRRSLRIE